MNSEEQNIDVWCIKPNSSRIWVEPVRTKADYKGRTQVKFRNNQQVRPKFCRCPNCGRRLVPQTINTEPYGAYPDLAFCIPPHKFTKIKQQQMIKAIKRKRAKCETLGKNY